MNTTVHEVDCIVETANQVVAIVVKSGKTIAGDYFKGLKYWLELTGHDVKNNYLIYGGQNSQNRSKAKVLSWHSVSKVLDDASLN